jgi:hypothetical protein
MRDWLTYLLMHFGTRCRPGPTTAVLVASVWCGRSARAGFVKMPVGVVERTQFVRFVSLQYSSGSIS